MPELLIQTQPEIVERPDAGNLSETRLQGRGLLILAVVQETMQPGHVSLWLCKNKQPGKPDINV